MESETRKYISIVLISVMLSLVFAAFSLFALPNTQAFSPDSSPTPTPPEITSFAPSPPVSDTVGNWRTFNVTVNQTVNVSWYLNGSPSPLHTNNTINEARYTLRAVIVGKHNVSASAVNENGTDMQTWIWNVTNPPCCDCGDICVNENGWWRCGSAFNLNDTPIQAAVDNATEGETICVMDGTYGENVDVDKRLTIKSKNGRPENCTVKALTASDPVFQVTADYVNITGFTVTGAKGEGSPGIHPAGIYLNGVEHGNISNNNVTNNYHGIYLDRSNNNTIMSNNASSNDYFGIYLYYANGNTVSNNHAHDNVNDGIYLEFSNTNNIIGNFASCEKVGICLDTSNGNTVSNNQVCDNDYEGIFLYCSSNNNNITGNTANSNNHYGIWLDGSNNNTLSDNIAFVNPTGIFLDGSNHNDLLNNNASGNMGGICLNASNHNDLLNNNASYNVGGIYLEGSDDNTLTNNNASDNYLFGIALCRSDDNTLTDNIALNNGEYMYPPQAENTILTDTLVGQEGFDGEGVGVYLFVSNNNTLTGNNASDNYLCGICLDGSDDNMLTDNIASNHWGYIYLGGSEETILTDTIVGQGPEMGVGICLGGSNNNTLTENIVSNNTIGILLVYSSDNTLTENTASGNMIGILVGYLPYVGSVGSDNELGGGYLSGSNNNTISGNTVSGNLLGGIVLSGYGYESFASGNELGDINPWGTSNNILSGNTVSGNMDGIVLLWSDYNTISDNIVFGNVDGIYLEGSDNNNLTGNDASNNEVDGIVLVESDNNDLTDNTASDNEVGILLVGYGNVNSFASGTELVGVPLYGSNNNILTGNTASSNTAYDFYSDEYAYNNIVDELLISSYPTTISFTYDNGVGIKGVTTPHPNPADKENIGKYLNATNVTETSWISLKVHYSDDDITEVEEGSLRLYHWNESTWEEIPGSDVNTGDNYVYGTVTSFCQIAPFGDLKPTPTPPPRGGGGGFKGSRDLDGDGYTDVEEALNGTDWHDPCDPDPYCDACPNKPTPSPTPTATPTTPPKQASVPPPVATPTPPTPEPPGFNVLYAILAFLGIAGLLGGAYYVFVLKP